MGKHRRSRGSGSGSDDSDGAGPSSSGSSSESSEDERERKRERKDKDSKDKDSKKQKKEKKKHKKEKGHRKHKDSKKDRDKGDDDARVKAAKEFLKQQLAGGAAPPAPIATLLPSSEAQKLPSDKQISDDDYFLKGNEFMAWLSEYKGKLFNELTTDESRQLFSQFVGVWNSGRLAAKYYGGLVQAPMKRTTHQWAFKKDGAGAGVSKGMAAFLDDQKDKAGAHRDQQRLDRKRRAGEERELLEELLPRATGRDALAEKRMARREDAKARGASPDRAFLPGGGDMMGGDESFEAAKAREAKRAEALRNRHLLKREEVSQKVAAAQAAEDEKMAKFRELLNKGPITIAKRQ